MSALSTKQSILTTFFFTHTKSWRRFLIVERSIGLLMTLRYVGNCLVFTGSKNGHESS